MWKRVLFIIFLFACLLTVSSTVHAVEHSGEVELRGVAVKIDPGLVSDILEDYERFDAEIYNAYKFSSESGEDYTVITTREPNTEPARIRGIVLDRYSGEHGRVIVEQSYSPLSIHQEVTYRDFYDRQSQFAGHGIIIRGGFSELSLTYDYRSQKFPLSSGYLDTELNDFDFGEISFARKGRQLAIETSNDSYESSVAAISSAMIGWIYETGIRKSDEPRGKYTTSFNQERFWFSGKAKVSVAVYSFYKSNNTSLFTISRSPTVTDNEADFEDIANNTEKYRDEVVRFKANSITQRISMKEAILTANSCGEESVMTSQGCIPLFVDTTVHAGIAYSGNGENMNTLPVFGLSNFDQDTLRTTETGKHLYTGRVVSMQKISPRLSEGYALVIYEQEKLGNTREGDLPSEYITGEAERFSSYMRDQVALSEEEWTAVKDDNEETLLNRYRSTPTAAPQESENTNAQSTPSSTTSGEAATPASTVVSTQPATGDEQNGTLINDIFPTLLIAAFVLILVVFVLSVANALASSLIWFIKYIEKKVFGESRYGKEAFGDFRVSFSCDNCGNVWERQFDQGDKIRETDAGARIYLESKSKRGNLLCPVCDTHHAVTIEDREPTE